MQPFLSSHYYQCNLEFFGDSKAIISLVNIYGHVVDEQQVTDSGRIKLEFNISGLQGGVYVLQLKKDGIVISEKIIVQ